MKDDWKKLLFDGEPIKEVTFDLVYDPMENANASVTFTDDHPYDMDILFEHGRSVTFVVEGHGKITGRAVGFEGNTVYLYFDQEINDPLR